MTIYVTKNEPGSTRHEYPTLFEAGFKVLEFAVDCPEGCTVEDSHSGHIFQVQHVADRLSAPRPVDSPTTPVQELKAA